MQQQNSRSKRNPLGLPKYQVDMDKVKVIESSEIWENCHEEFLRNMGQARVLGFDCEWRPNFKKGSSPNKIAILQLATMTAHCLILQLKHWKRIPASLNKLMTDSTVIKLGVGSKDDVERLQSDYKIKVLGTVDLRVLTQKVGLSPEYSEFGLQKLGLRILNLDFGKSKNTTMSNWETKALTPTQQKYAAIDAIGAVDIFRHLVSRKVPEFKCDPENCWMSAKHLWEDSIDLYDLIQCDICNQKLLSGPPMFQHLAGDKHKKQCLKKGIPVEITLPSNEQKTEVYSTSAKVDDEEELEEGEIVDDFDDVPIVTPKAAQMSKYHCDMCSVSTMGPEELQQHMTSAKHHQKLRLLQRCDSHEQQYKKQQTIQLPDSTTSPSRTTENKHTVSQDLMIDQALRSIRESTVSLSVNTENSPSSSGLVSSTMEHQTSTGNTEGGSLNEEEVRATRIDSLYCDLCKVSTTERSAMVAHLDGKKHKKKLKNHVVEDSDLFCAVCQCSVTDLSGMESHLIGKRHRTNVLRAGKVPN